MQTTKFRITLKQIQILVWSLLFLLMFLFMLKGDPILSAFINTLITVSFYALVVYGNALWLIPALYRRKKIAAYIIVSILFLCTAIIARMGLEWKIYNSFFASKPEPFPAKYLVNYLFSGLFVYLFSIVFRLAIDYFSLRQQQEKMALANAQAELNLLKAQVQPHFVFNTLNNIYYVAQKESPVAADMIEKLSGIMRYFVDEGASEKLPLATELEFIRNYIDLEKLRMRFPLVEEWKICVQPEQIWLPPMLLIPMIENVFKHGIDKRRDDNFIAVHIMEMESALQIQVKNRMPSKPLQMKNNPGTGISNLQKRLQLLYKNNHQLSVEATDDLFICELKIPLCEPSDVS